MIQLEQPACERVHVSYDELNRLKRKDSITFSFYLFLTNSACILGLMSRMKQCKSKGVEHNNLQHELNGTPAHC